MSTATVSSARQLITDELYDQLVRRVQHDRPQFDRPGASEIVGEALAFLDRCAAKPAGAKMEPTKREDIGWHTFLLYTKEYAKLCARLAGRFIHHTPALITDNSIHCSFSCTDRSDDEGQKLANDHRTDCGSDSDAKADSDLDRKFTEATV